MMQAAARLTLVCALATLVMVAGCTGSLLESKQPVPTIYVLAPAPAPAKTTSTTQTSIDIAISLPTAAPGLDSERIALLHEARRLDYYLGAQWGAALPQVVQSLLVGSLQNLKSFRSVTSEQARVNAAYLLDLDVRDFQAEYKSEDAAPVIRVSMSASLIRIKDRKLIAAIPATSQVNAEGNRLGAVVAAFEAATQQVATSIGQEAISAINASSP